MKSYLNIGVLISAILFGIQFGQAKTVILGAKVVVEQVNGAPHSTARPYIGFYDSVFDRTDDASLCYYGKIEEVCSVAKSDIANLSAQYQQDGAEEDIALESCKIVADDTSIPTYVAVKYQLINYHSGPNYLVDRKLFACDN